MKFLKLTLDRSNLILLVRNNTRNYNYKFSFGSVKFYSSKNDNINDESEWFQSLTKNDKAPMKDKPKNSFDILFKASSKEGKRKYIRDMWEKGRNQGKYLLLTELKEEHYEKLENSASLGELERSFLYIARKISYKMQDEERKKKVLERKQKTHSELDIKKQLGQPITNYPGYTSYLKIVNTDQISYFYQNKLLSSIRNDAPKIVFDFRYELQRENNISSLFKQLSHAIGSNLKVKEPFQLFYCNYKYESKFNQKFGTKTQSGENQFNNNFISHTFKSYMDLFPKNRLVYLSNDARSEMTKFDHEKIYIIGAIVDKSTENLEYASYSQALKDGIRCERLPIESYVQWKQGAKNLSLDHVFKILLNLYNNGNDMKRALLDSIPARKYHNSYSK